jgi:hypothetical protein
VYCLQCSPYGKHNTRVLAGDDRRFASTVPSGTTLKCVGCLKDYRYRPSGGTTTRMCGNCNVLKARTLQKMKAVQYKGGVCIKCGYNRTMAALTFHHRDPSKKEFQISGGNCKAWGRVQAELDKCDILCSTCHTELHAEVLQERIQRLLAF